MNVSLTSKLEEFVNKKVASGLYTSASEVIRESLRLLAETENLRGLHLQELRKAISLGIAEANSGKLLPFNPVTIKHEGLQLLKRIK